VSNNATIAREFYTAMSNKKLTAIEPFVHPDIEWSSPMGQTSGKEEYLASVKGFMNFFKSLTIRAACGSEDHATIVYDLEFPAPIGIVPTAALMTFKDGLIAKIELIYDARPFAPSKA
jgi:hypothetical protein